MEWLSKHLEGFERKTILVLVLVNLTLIFTNVLLRYGFNRTLTWGEELSRYLFVAITYFGASAGVKAKGHILVDLLLVLFPKTKIALFIMSNFLSAIFCLLLFITSFKFAYFLKSIGQTTTGLALPMWIPYLSVVLGSLMMSFRFYEAFLNTVRRKKV